MNELRIVCGKFGRIYIARITDEGIVEEEKDVTNEAIAAVAMHLDHESGPNGIDIKTRAGMLSWNRMRGCNPEKVEYKEED